MLTGLAVLALLAGLTPAAPPPDTPQAALEQVFADYCRTVPDQPACSRPGTPAGYKWLLLQDACGASPAPDVCPRFAAIRDRTEPLVLAYSHRDGVWRAKFAFEVHDKTTWAFDRDVDGTPIVTAGRSDDCLVIVEETKPLTYSVQLGKITEKENDLAGGLSDLAALLGGTLTATAPLVGKHQIPIEAPGWSELLQAFGRIERPDAFDVLGRTMTELGQQLQPLGPLKADVVSALNVAEASDTGAISPVDWTTASLDGAQWRERFAHLRATRDAAMASLQGGQPTADQQTLLTQAQKLIDKQAEIAKAVAALAATKVRWDEFVSGDHVRTWMVVPLPGQPVRWTKDQTYAFSVVPDSAFSSDVITRRSKVETSVRFTSPRASMFGVDAGLIITPGLKETTYKAVADSAGVKRITATDSATRTGKVALFFDWRPVQAWYPKASSWAIRPMLQVGVAVDTKTPGAFVGGGFDLTKWLRVSVGATWLAVKTLDGQQPNDEVASDDAIRTKTQFPRSLYYAVSLSLDGLPFFKSK
jgi:hypothetical protein